MIQALMLSAALIGPPAPPVSKGQDRQAGEERGARAWAWGACAATGGDLASTEWALSRGGMREGNVLVKSRAVRVGMGAVTCGGELWLARKDAKLARKVGIGAVVVRGALTLWNVRQALR